MDKNRLKTEGKWLVACSGGPDSMALLDMCVKAGMYVEAAHVNYHKRSSADRDMKLVQEYCLKNGVSCHILNEEYVVKGNFQAFARNYRYRFFADIVKENELDGVLVAHNLDDVLETYLMQMKKHLKADHYGLKDETVICGVKVLRPLLDMRKKQLQEYCDENGVAYGVDESNLTNAYTRNQIRHHEVEDMSDEDIRTLLEQMDECNRISDELNDKAEALVDDVLDLHAYRQADEEVRWLALRRWFGHHHIRESRASGAYIRELDGLMMSGKQRLVALAQVNMHITAQTCEIVGNEYKNYAYVLKSIHPSEHEWFKVCLEGTGVEAVTVSEEDLPLTIRNALPGDVIEMRFGHKNVHRWFIDRKIPMGDRLVWPVVVNAKGQVILVPGIGCDVAHYSMNPNMFVVKL